MGWLGPSVLIQIENIEAQIEELQAELAALPPEVEPPPESSVPLPPGGQPPLDPPDSPPSEPTKTGGDNSSPVVLPPRLAGRWLWLVVGLLVIGGLAGLGGWGYRAGWPPFAAPTPPPEPFNPATYPPGAVAQPVQVRLWAAPGCAEPINTLAGQIQADPLLAELIASGQVTLDKRDEAYSLADVPDNPALAALDIEADCSVANPKLHFKLGDITGLPPEVYSPGEVVVADQPGNPLLARNIALGLTHYERRDFSNAAERLASTAREDTILGLLYGNSLLFQTPPDLSEADQVYLKAAKAFEEVVVKHDTSSDLEAMVHNNRGVALLSQAIK